MRKKRNVFRSSYSVGGCWLQEAGRDNNLLKEIRLNWLSSFFFIIRAVLQWPPRDCTGRAEVSKCFPADPEPHFTPLTLQQLSQSTFRFYLFLILQEMRNRVEKQNWETRFCKNVHLGQWKSSIFNSIAWDLLKNVHFRAISVKRNSSERISFHSLIMTQLWVIIKSWVIISLLNCAAFYKTGWEVAGDVLQKTAKTGLNCDLQVVTAGRMTRRYGAI